MREKKEPCMRGSARSLILCVHAHQPIGNFEHVFEEAFEKSYRPFFEVLEKHPAVPVVCHFSGSLIDWLEKTKPRFIELTQRLSRRGQVEFLGGAYYEPIYGAIPPRDLLGQIEKMRQKIKGFCGEYPRGAWLTERVWDPHLPGLLKRARVEYTVVDDFHLEKARVRPPVTGYFRTGGGALGPAVDLFASMKELRYLIPFKEPEETAAYVRQANASPQEVLVFADDLEKFGLWPGTWSWVYPHGWLDRWFGCLEKDPGIRLYTFDRFRRDFKPRKTVRVPHASYSEMMEWSGGRFYNFFDKYPESRYMRDRMWSLSDRLEKEYLKNGLGESARDALYRAQCNCAYWHGVFGGLYLHHLRSAVFENLIQAEKLLASHQNHRSGPGQAKVGTETLSSGKRWRLEQEKIVSFFNPALGGALEELDDLSGGFNLMCNVRRRHEGYHRMLTAKVSAGTDGGEAPLSIHHLLGFKEPGLERHLFYDRTRRFSFVDHFFAREVSPEEFRTLTYAETGDFAGRPYRLRVRSPALDFERKAVLNAGGNKTPVILKKTITPDGGSALRARYRIKNAGRRPLDFVFGVEFNFSIGQEVSAGGNEARGVREWALRDPWRGVSLRWSSPQGADFFSTPVETVSESEYGLERTYQGLSVLSQRRLGLLPGQTCEHQLRLEVDGGRAHAD
ncbi:MAG: DUF1926 domain-containing protein [Candidatus Omnitrophica bacterium]|nr:DUF1926 domain-containing protein [Candidatus Omnitrophota bacterium]